MPLAIGMGIGIGYDLQVTGDAEIPPTDGFLLFEDNFTEFEREDFSGELLLEGS